MAAHPRPSHTAPPSGTGRNSRSERNVLLVTGTAVAGVLAAACLSVSAVAVRLVLGDRSSAWESLLVGAGTVAGTLALSWLAQPPLYRLVTRIARAR